MGAACCVAARDENIVSGSGRKDTCRNIRNLSKYSSRWDNREHVAGEDISVSFFSDAISRNDGSEIRYESASEDGNPSESFESRTRQKSATSEVTAGRVRTLASDQSISRNISIDEKLEEVNETVESPAASRPSHCKLSIPFPETSFLVTSPSSSQSHVHSTSSTTTRLPLRSPRHHRFRQVSDNQLLELKSPNRYSVGEERLMMPSCRNEFTRGSWYGASKGSSMHAYSEIMDASHVESGSFDDDTWGFHHEKISKSSGRILAPSSVDLQLCGVCSKLLSKKSLWSSQKIIHSNELSVVAILTCGHVYHAECLENTTPEFDKYDPSCPICTLGEKKHKSSEQAFKAESDFKTKINKRSSSRVVDSVMDSDPVVFNRLKSSGHERRASNSSMKNSIGRTFLQKHFYFGAKCIIKSPSENHSTWKKGFFPVKTSKI